MVRNILQLFELLSYLYCFAATYGKKMKYNIYTVIFVVAELVLMTGLNEYGLPTYFVSVSYALMFAYCLLNYKSSTVQALINILMSIFMVGILQLLIYFVLVTVFRDDNRQSLRWEFAVMSISLLIVCLIIPKLRLDYLSNFLVRKRKLTYIISCSVIVIFGSRIWKIKENASLSGEDFIFTVYFYILLLLLLIEWQKTKVYAEKKKVQLEMNKLYYTTYEDLIYSIRENQHDYKNHINAIRGMLYTAHDYEDLVQSEEKYLDEIAGNYANTSILTLVENPLLAGFLTVKIHEAESKKINVEHHCILTNQELKVPEYQLIEMMGILVDNAIEAIETRDKKQMYIGLTKEQNSLIFETINPCDQSVIKNIPTLFSKGYSSKGVYRGIGLPKLKKMVQDVDGELGVGQTFLNGNMAIRFELLIPI